MTPEELQAMAAQQWLDPQILELAAQATWLWAPAQWGGDSLMAMQDPVWAPGLPPQPNLPIEEVFAQSPLVIHVDEMMPILQQSRQDEVMAFIRKILDVYMWL